MALAELPCTAALTDLEVDGRKLPAELAARDDHLAFDGVLHLMLRRRRGRWRLVEVLHDCWTRSVARSSKRHGCADRDRRTSIERFPVASACVHTVPRRKLKGHGGSRGGNIEPAVHFVQTRRPYVPGKRQLCECARALLHLVAQTPKVAEHPVERDGGKKVAGQLRCDANS